MINFSTLQGLAIPKVPKGYTQVEYIESSGTQYIDTGFKPNQDTRVVMDVQAIAAPGTLVYFGVRQTQKVKSFLLFKINDTSLRSDYGNTSASIAVTTYTDRVIIDADRGVTKYGDLSVTHTAETFQSDYPLALLALRTRDKFDSQMSAKLYSCKIYDNGTLVRDFVPCKNASGTVGLYDVVNNVFYTNAGTGTFTAGAESSCVVTQIADASGRVLWSMAKTVVVTLESDLPSGGSTIMGIDYSTADGSYYNISSAGTYELPIGTVIDFWIGPEKGRGSANIYVNDEYVTGSRDGEKCSYYHTLTTNIIISVSIGTSYGAFYITEVPVAFTIDSTTYFAQENMTWAEWFTSSHNTTGKTADGVSTITDSKGNTVNLTDIIVGGTAYEVEFAKPVTITVTGTGLDDYVYIMHAEGGYTRYTSPTTFTANVGDTIHCYCTECWGGYPTTYIRVNDLTMAYTNDDDDISYDYTVVSDATINLYENYASTKRDRVGRIDIYDGNA